MDLSAAARHASHQPVIEHYVEPGFNFRMTDIQAAVGLVQLGKLGELVARRRGAGSATSSCLLKSQAFGRSWILPTAPRTTSRSGSSLPENFPVSREGPAAAPVDAGVLARRGIMAAHL